MSQDPLAQLIIKPIQSACRHDLISLYRDAGWWEASWDRNPEFLDHVVKDSAVFIGAFLDKKIIGMGRALSDLASDAYIQDVAVLKKFRGRGIGKKIIQALIKILRHNNVDWIGLVAEPGTSCFYSNLGFQVLKDHVPLKYEER